MKELETVSGKVRAKGHIHDDVLFIRESDEETLKQFYNRLSGRSVEENPLDIGSWKSEDPEEIDRFGYWADFFESSNEYELTDIRKYRFESPNKIKRAARSRAYGLSGYEGFSPGSVYVVEGRNSEGNTQIAVLGDEESRAKVESYITE